MGMATGYRWDALRNFVISLRYTNFAVRCALPFACALCVVCRVSCRAA
jgi:hypothetical protein